MSCQASTGLWGVSGAIQMGNLQFYNFFTILHAVPFLSLTSLGLSLIDLGSITARAFEFNRVATQRVMIMYSR